MIVHVKDNWQQVTLGEFQQILETQTDKVLNDFQKDLKLIQILSTITEDELNALPVNELRPLLKAIEFLGSEISLVDLKDYYRVNGKEYKLVRDITNLTGGQFTDLMNLVQDKEQVNNNLHYIIGVLMAPVCKDGFIIKKNRTEKYLEITSLDDIAEDMKLLCIQDVHSISNFFFALSVNFQAAFFGYMEREIPNQLKEVSKILKKKKKLSQVEQDLQQQINLLVGSGASGM